MRRTPNPSIPSADRSVTHLWFVFAAYLEDAAPAHITADQLARVEDTAAEWLFQRSRFRSRWELADYS
jgi:hypothetical protein